MKNSKRAVSSLSPLGQRMVAYVIATFTKELETYSDNLNKLRKKKGAYQKEMIAFHRHFYLLFKIFFGKKEQMAYKNLVKATNTRGQATSEGHALRLAYCTDLLDSINAAKPSTGKKQRSTTMKFTRKSNKTAPHDTAPVFPGFPKPSNAPEPIAVITFVCHIIEFLRQLRAQGPRNHGTRMTQAGKGNREESIRDSFFLYLHGRYDHVAIEVLKGKGRIDIVAYDKLNNIELKLELKGWWNPRKTRIIPQILSYMTEFEDYAFVIIINDTKKDIHFSYQSIVVRKNNKYIHESWHPHFYKGTRYTYYSSEHQVGNSVKKIYHFIY